MSREPNFLNFESRFSIIQFKNAPPRNLNCKTTRVRQCSEGLLKVNRVSI